MSRNWPSSSVWNTGSAGPKQFRKKNLNPGAKLWFARFATRKKKQNKNRKKRIICWTSEQENIAAGAGQDSKRVGVGIVLVLGKVFSPIVRAVFENIGKKSKNGQKWPKNRFLRLSSSLPVELRATLPPHNSTKLHAKFGQNRTGIFREILKKVTANSQ